MRNDTTLSRWFLQRITGFLLVFFLAVHIITLHFSSSNIVNFNNVILRVQSSFLWLAFYVAFLLLTLWHGFNGVYEIINDYNLSNGLLRLIKWFCWLLGIILFAWGFQVLLIWWIY